MKKTVTTLALIEREDEVLLAMKKRGFGEGWWNGYGGKVGEEETIEEAMVREVEEESTLVAKEWRQRGTLCFHFRDTQDIIEMHIFEVTGYEGEPVETEEMRPEWFKKSEVPYHEMWPNDREWLEMFFDGRDFEGKVFFSSPETKQFIESDIKTVESDIRPESEIPRGSEGMT